MLILEGTKDGTGLLIEDFDETNVLVEYDENKNKQVFIEGLYSVANRKLRNPRTYSKPLLEREVSGIQKVINEKKCWMEATHPNTMQINFDRVAGLVTELHWEGNNLYGKSVLANTPMGNIAKGLAEIGNIGVSTRGSGTVKNGMVQDNYRLKTWDIVLEPSVYDSVMTLVREQEDLMLQAGANEQMLEEFIKEIKTGNKKKDYQKYIMETFKEMLKI